MSLSVTLLLSAKLLTGATSPELPTRHKALSSCVVLCIFCRDAIRRFSKSEFRGRPEKGPSQDLLPRTTVVPVAWYLIVKILLAPTNAKNPLALDLRRKKLTGLLFHYLFQQKNQGKIAYSCSSHKL